jgi:ubiquinone/menaquinone biosynthesis C-methylase UbiE
MSSEHVGPQQRLREVAKKEGFLWGNQVAETYFSRAERDMERHWNEIIRPQLEHTLYDTVLDIAAGRGRNSARLAARAKQIICVDINPDNISFMQARFEGDRRFCFVQNDGLLLDGIADEAVDLAYSFDSMVHFDMEVVISYIKESFRVVRPGGHAFIHHSNYIGSPGCDFRGNPHWRNFMSIPLFRHIAVKAGFTVLMSQPMAWGGVADLDGIALLQKPMLSPH